MKNRIAAICLIVCLPFCASGCFFATRLVNVAGTKIVDPSFSPIKTWVSKKGDILIEADFFFEKYNDDKSSTPKYKRYVKSDQDMFEKMLGEKSKIGVEDGVEIHELIIPVDNPYSQGWELIPHNYKFKNVTKNLLPADFEQNYEECGKGSYFDYYADGKRIKIFIYRIYTPNTIRKTKWWHYPAQILVIPAVAVDVATLPIQAAMIFWYGNQHCI